MNTLGSDLEELNLSTNDCLIMGGILINKWKLTA